MISDLVKYATLFAGLTAEEQSIIVQAMHLQHFAAHETIYAEGDESIAFYLLEHGGVRLSVETMILATLGAGATFGESGVFLARQRAVAATTTMATDAWAITRDDLEKIIQDHPAIGVKLSRNFGSPIAQIKKYLINNRLRRNRAFRALTNEELAELAAHLELIDLPAGTTLYRKDEHPTEFYILEEGAVIIGEEEEEQVVEAGGVVGLIAMLDEFPSDEFAVAQTDTVAWKLSKQALDGIAATSPLFWQHLTSGAQESTQIADEDRAIERLRALPLFGGLDETALRKVAKQLIIIRVAAGAIIYNSGSQADRVHIIEDGQVELRWPKGVLHLKEGDIFGEEAILSGEPHLETAFAKTDSELWELSQSDLESLIMAAPIVGLNLSRELSHKLHKLAEQETAGRKVVAVPMPVSPPVDQAPPTQIIETPAAATVVTSANERAPARAKTSKFDALALWFGGLSRGAKWRLALVVLLLIWLLGIAIPWTVVNAFQGSEAPTNSGDGPAIAIAEEDDMQPVAMALARLDATHTPQATATYTPLPTDTPTPTNTPTPTPTPTNTPTPTPTPTNTPTPIPTNTPIPTPTPRPVVHRPAMAAARAAATPTPATQYSLVEVRRLAPCENRGKHNIYVKVIDANGNGVNDIWVIQAVAGDPGNIIEKKRTHLKDYWIMKPENGRVTLDMYKFAQYTVYISDDGVHPASTDFTQALHSGFTDEAECPEGGGGNTLFHNSFSVIFRKNW